jgi:hypothetical protein
MPTTPRMATGFMMAGADQNFSRLGAFPFL